LNTKIVYPVLKHIFRKDRKKIRNKIKLELFVDLL